MVMVNNTVWFCLIVFGDSCIAKCERLRESVRARLRILVRQTLRKYKYPPDKTAGAVELILKQVEVVSNSWTS